MADNGRRRSRRKDEPVAAGESDAELERQEALAVDQTHSDSDQTLSDSDQTASDADQASSDADSASAQADQESADADQEASDRDQVAADRELEGSPPSSALRGAHDASREVRAEGSTARQATAATRSETGDARSRQATQRDQTARRRDLAAAARDRNAEARDRAADRRVGWFPPARGSADPIVRAHQELVAVVLARAADDRATAAEDRARAAEDRARAAEDRGRAAADRARAAADRRQARIDLESAHVDELTGVYTRAMGLATLQHEIDRSRRSCEPFVLAFIDVDGLKEVNDRQGHAAGDALLRRVILAIKSNLRSYDPIVRVGGDEFVCGFTNTTPDAAARRVHEIQMKLEQGELPSSISVGLAPLAPNDTLDDLTARGDAALYQAKTGR